MRTQRRSSADAEFVVAYVQHIELRTRLELFLRRMRLSPLTVAKMAGYSRQHVLRVRLGDAFPTRRFVIEVTDACRTLSGRDVTAAALFERGDDLLRSEHQRLSRMFVAERAELATFFADVAAEDWHDRLVAAHIRCETAVVMLLAEGAARTDTQPREAATIFLAAAGIATRLPETAEELAASLQAYALKGRANALRHIGAFDEALADLALAARLFVKARYCANDAGRVEYTRGTVLFTLERFAEARAAAQHARARFVASNDTRGATHADLLLAGILFDEGSVNAARDMWLRVRPVLADLDDADALARVSQNLGACEIRRGDRAAARRWLREAAAAFRRLGNRVELARTQWNIASYVATFRSKAAGMTALRHVERTFARLGAHVDAACVGLDLIELMLDGGGHDAALTEHAHEVANALVRAGLGASAATALDQLRRIAQLRDQRTVVANVRAAVREADASCRTAVREGERAVGAPGHAPGPA